MSLIINPYSFGAGVVTPLLDVYSGAAAAYSVRKLRTAYTGSCMRVRRPTDNAETDIGFTSAGVLDTGAMSSFYSATNYVVKWYDQSGNGNNATNNTYADQPFIEPGTRINNKPYILFGSGTPRLFSGSLGGAFAGEDIPHGFYFVGQPSSIGTSNLFQFVDLYAEVDGASYLPYLLAGSGNDRVYGSSMWDGYGLSSNYNLSAVVNRNYQYLLQVNSTGTALTQYWNGSSTAALNAVSQNVGYCNFTSFSLGNDYDGAFGGWENYFQEFIFYVSDTSSDRTGIRDNINSYFGVY